MGAHHQAFEYFVATGRTDYIPPKEGDVEEPTEISDELVGQVSQKTGLTPTTVAELLVKGWRYIEALGETSRWEHPSWQLHERTFAKQFPDPYGLRSNT